MFKRLHGNFDVFLWHYMKRKSLLQNFILRRKFLENVWFNRASCNHKNVLPTLNTYYGKCIFVYNWLITNNNWLLPGSAIIKPQHRCNHYVQNIHMLRALDTGCYQLGVGLSTCVFVLVIAKKLGLPSVERTAWNTFLYDLIMLPIIPYILRGFLGQSGCSVSMRMPCVPEKRLELSWKFKINWT